MCWLNLCVKKLFFFLRIREFAWDYMDTFIKHISKDLVGCDTVGEFEND